ncbi:MAG: DEAD/DEAH box helicase [Pseudomonadota bacterium]
MRRSDWATEDIFLTDVTFAGLGLADPVLRALEARDHATPTPIQQRAIPQLISGRDMLGIAQTGTGKTGAFTLPMLHRFIKAPRPKTARGTRALVLAPTRELAIQIGDEFKAYSYKMGMSHTVVFGGVSQKPQVAALRRGVDVIVATPGRLLDLMSQPNVDVGLSTLEYLVLDEADRMLDMGFINDIRRILKVVPRERQTLLFSATMPAEIAKLSGDVLLNPLRVEVTPQATTVDRIKQTVHHVDRKAKRELLQQIVQDSDLNRVLVFTRTKHRANRVAEHLNQAGIDAAAIHGNKSQSARQAALKNFKDGTLRVLVATDIAARGIDIDRISHVINFELPNEPQSYVHRIGRTARAGASGSAISFCDASERGYLGMIQKTIGMKIEVVGDGPVGPDMEPPVPGSHRAKTPKARPGRRPHRGLPQRSGETSTPERADGKPSTSRRRRRKPKVRKVAPA